MKNLLTIATSLLLLSACGFSDEAPFGPSEPVREIEYIAGEENQYEVDNYFYVCDVPGIHSFYDSNSEAPGLIFRLFAPDSSFYDFMRERLAYNQMTVTFTVISIYPLESGNVYSGMPEECIVNISIYNRIAHPRNSTMQSSISSNGLYDDRYFNILQMQSSSMSIFTPGQDEEHIEYIAEYLIN